MLRELSYWLDCRPKIKASTVRTGKNATRGRAWLKKLDPRDQAVFFPIDRHNYSAMLERGLVPAGFGPDDHQNLLADPEAYLDAAETVARWCLKHELDLRELNFYGIAWEKDIAIPMDAY